MMRLLFLAWIVLFLWDSHRCFGASHQEFQLRKGWNALALQIDASNLEIEALLRDSPIDEVMRPTIETEITDISDWNRTGWIRWKKGEVSTLRTLGGGGPLFVHSTNNFEWKVSGAVSRPRPYRTGKRFLLAEVSVVPGMMTDLRSYFGTASGSQRSLEIYRLTDTGSWARADTNEALTISADEVVLVKRPPGGIVNPPILAMTDRIEFGELDSTHEVQLRNGHNFPQTLDLRASNEISLYVWQIDSKPGGAGWKALDANHQYEIEGGGLLSLRLAVDRTSSLFDRSRSEVLSHLTITVNSGGRLDIPVRIKNSSAAGAGSKVGLWIGDAKVSGVSYSSSALDVNRRQVHPVAEPFSFRLMLHVNTEGQVHLLKSAIILSKSGKHEYIATNEEAARVLISRGDYAYSAWLDSVSFAHRDPVVGELRGVFGAPESEFKTLIDLDFDDERNPFVHRFHPDHDNLNERFDEDKRLKPGEESYSIRREISLTFLPRFSDDIRFDPAWGDLVLGGTFGEIVTGVHKEPLYVSGNFKLSKVSTASELYAGPK